MFKGISKETKVGSLTAVTITFLILGYNFMVGRDNPFKTARKFVVMYDSAQGLQISTPVIFNGFKIGQLKRLELLENNNRIKATLEIYSNVNIPKNSRVMIQSEILGGMKMIVHMGNSKEYASSGDTLQAEYAKDVMSMVNEKIAPIAAGADSLLANLNALIGRASLQRTFDELPALVSNLSETISNLRETIDGLRPGLTASLNNIGAFSNNLDAYGKSLNKTLQSFERLGSQLDSVQLAKMSRSLELTLNDLNAVLSGINAGNGTLGKLAKDEALYSNLNSTLLSLECLLNDLKAYPEKYVPLPWGKSQRKKAKKKSDLNKCFPKPKDSSSLN